MRWSYLHFICISAIHIISFYEYYYYYYCYYDDDDDDDGRLHYKCIIFHKIQLQAIIITIIIITIIITVIIT